jgi:hypothetical protein
LMLCLWMLKVHKIPLNLLNADNRETPLAEQRLAYITHQQL